jgi:DNA adenine methylase
LFNVPIGTSLKKDIADNGILRLCHDILQDAEIKHQPYQNINPKEGDLVFFDPPYAPISATSSFTSYTSEEFGGVQQAQLKEFCDSLNERGIKFMLANSNCEFIRELYQNYNQYTFALDRKINCKGDLRKQIEDNEILVTNFSA